MASIDEIANGIYRVSTYDARIGLSFNQYLIEDDQPTLVHTGSVLIFDDVLARVRQVIDPLRLMYAFISHFEADECGALARWRAVAPGLTPVCSAVTARQLEGFGICSSSLIGQEDEELSLGRRQLRFMTYPSEMHLWDGLLAFDETDELLFSSDLFIQRGEVTDPLVHADASTVLNIAARSIPDPEARAACLAKIKARDPKRVAPGHGPVFDLQPVET